MAEYASLRKIEFELCGGNLPEKYKAFVRRVLNDRNLIPAADVAPVVHGHWVVRFEGPYKRRKCYCSHCGKHNGIGGIVKNQEKPYCPNCGAKMDGGVDDEADGNV